MHSGRVYAWSFIAPCSSLTLSMGAPTVSIIIPVYNQWSYTAECLEALHQHSDPAIPTELIVVDNASTDETAAGLAEWQAKWPAVRAETLASNTGFSPACNRGAELSRGEFLLFLNNDTVPQAGWLEPLLQEVKEPGVGIVGPKLVYAGGQTINHAGYVFGDGVFYGIYHEHDAAAPYVNKRRDYQALLGACILLSRDLFFSLGAFSLEGLEDIDLCLKAGARSLSSRYVPTSTVVHHGSITLTNSTPGSFPITTDTGFVERWGQYVIRWDDYYWHIQDGVWTPPQSDELGRSGAELAHLSIVELVAAKALAREGDASAALEKTVRSLEIWPLNPLTFLFHCQLLYLLERRADLLTELQRVEEFSFGGGLVVSKLFNLVAAIQPGDESEI